MHSDQVDSCLAQLVGIIWWEDEVRSAGHGPGTVSLLCVSIPEHTLLCDMCTQVFQRADGHQKTCERIWLSQGMSLTTSGRNISKGIPQRYCSWRAMCHERKQMVSELFSNSEVKDYKL